MESGFKAKRGSGGRFLPGTAPGPGRPTLPEWFTSSHPKLLEIQMRALMDGRLPVAPPREGETHGADDVDAFGNLDPVTTQVIPAAVRMEVANRLLDRIVGKPTQALEVSGETTVNHTLGALLAARAALQPTEDEKAIDVEPETST